MSGLFVVVMIVVAVLAAVMNGTRVMGRTIAQLGCRDVQTSGSLPYVIFLRIHNRDCRHCMARLTGGMELRKRLK